MNLSKSWILVILGVIASFSLVCGKSYGESCSSNMDCDDTKYCDKQLSKCGCIWKDQKHQKFNHDSKRCEVLVDSICSLKEEKNKASWPCVENGQCLHRQNFPKTLGICECKPGFAKSNTGLCTHSRFFPAKLDSHLHATVEDHGRTPVGKKSGSGQLKSSLLSLTLIVLSTVVFVFQ